jgi:hypothetical protein
MHALLISIAQEAPQVQLLYHLERLNYFTVQVMLIRLCRHQQDTMTPH